MNSKLLDKIALVLTIVGGINWGVIGIFKKNLVYEIFGNNADIERVIYIVVGVAAAYLAYVEFSSKRRR